MTWEETIEYIRAKPDYADLVEQAYFEENLQLNVERFVDTQEFKETLSIIDQYEPNAKTILDIGCGNGISAINFALRGYRVAAVEPDPSNTVGAGAIRKLKEIYGLNNIIVYESLAEEINFKDSSFDIVYIRQAMHHANDLNKFIKESVRVLKPGGLLLTIRDHVVFDQKDKEWFLEMHPLHKFYGGENAFTPEEYRGAIKMAGAEIKKELKYYDSVINYFPLSKNDIAKMKDDYTEKIKRGLRRKLGFLGKFHFVFSIYKLVKGISDENIYDESQVPGRMYSYIAIKK
jgi:ubiquinone/menaquinone biosynthesis C-methylase UbiE